MLLATLGKIDGENYSPINHLRLRVMNGSNAHEPIIKLNPKSDRTR